MKLQLLSGIVTGINAAIVHTFHDGNCSSAQYIGETNVYDNSCSYQPGFSSYMVVLGTGQGQPEQMVTAYSRNACAGPQTACGNVLGICYKAFNGDGASNALSSGVSCGVV